MTADEILHEAYRAPVIYRRTPEEIRCKSCGRWLKTYYAEERLYSVKCFGCGYVAFKPEAHRRLQSSLELNTEVKPNDRRRSNPKHRRGFILRYPL